MKKNGSLLIVDDNKNVLSALRLFLSDYFEHIHLLSSPKTLLSELREHAPDVILLDMNFSTGINTGNEGLYWLAEIQKIDSELPVVLFTAYADIDLVIKALKSGATDFVVKPWDNAKLLTTLQTALSLRQSRKEVKKLRDRQTVMNRDIQKEEAVCWGKSTVMQHLLTIIRKVAATDANVLITGENGTGKELIARTIHCCSSRASEAFVAVDMGAVTETLFESELFGHVKGAYTDARADRAGKFEAADGGSLFLDEIGNLGYPLQAKLLSALQSRHITRVGSNQSVPVDIRLITATNRNLLKSVKEGEFREDLLYRINTIHIEVPPLRERREDIAQLAHFFLDRWKKKYNKNELTISERAIGKLEDYPWPGNVRELEHTIEKAVILSDNNELQPADFYLHSTDESMLLMESFTFEKMEQVLIEKALRKFDNNLSAVASELGVSRPTLYSKMKKYGL